MGLTRVETLCLPWGELLDLIAIEQIKTEGFTQKENEEDAFWALLTRK